MVHRIAVIEDHFLQRRYASTLIGIQPDMTVTFEGEDLPQFMAWLETADETSRPELILLDLMAERGPNARPETVRQLVFAGFRVVVFSAIASPPLARQMIKAGVHGFISKRDNEQKIMAALRAIIAGDWWVSPELAVVIAHDQNRPKLSDQEERALILYASGLPLEAVSASLGVKPNTTKKYLQRVRNKYANVDRPLSSRLDWNQRAAEDGYLALAEDASALPFLPSQNQAN